MNIMLSQDMKLSEMQIDTARNMFSASMSEMSNELEPSWAQVIDAEIVE